jgi:hypothetical protein
LTGYNRPKKEERYPDMSFKDDVEYVKEELGSDEKLLENAFKLERIYKKHKYKIWTLLAVLVLGLGGKAAYGAYTDYRLSEANEALLSLKKNPDDSSALETLKSKNPELYGLYVYSQAVKRADAKKLSSLETNGDSLLADISAYHAAVLESKAGDSRYYKDLSLLEKAYEAIKSGKRREAGELLSLIAENSPVAPVARYLKHYSISEEK